jgi:hypothetical protein
VSSVSTRTVEEQVISLFIFLSTMYICKVSRNFSKCVQNTCRKSSYLNLAQSLCLLKSVVAYAETVFLVAFAIIIF